MYCKQVLRNHPKYLVKKLKRETIQSINNDSLGFDKSKYAYR